MSGVLPSEAVAEAMRQLREATAARKCWGCGCLHGSLKVIEQVLAAGERPAELDAAIEAARGRLTPIQYECLGCEVCYPPLAMNALGIEGEACPAEAAESRSGWPPLPGSYAVLRYRAPVAICTLTDDGLTSTVAAGAGPEVAMVGSLHTENLGIERIVQNVLANPNIRVVVVCGTDSRHEIGHLPGQSLLALARGGVDEHGRIVGAKGKRPLLKNVPVDAIEHFRKSTELVDLIGCTAREAVLAEASRCGARDLGPAEPFSLERMVPIVQGYLPERMVSDSAGYFVVYPDAKRQVLTLEHYTTSGVLDVVIEGKIAAEVYVPAVARGLVSRLDHAAYLGRELARAERALLGGDPYVQDAAPERRSVLAVNGTAAPCACGPACGGQAP